MQLTYVALSLLLLSGCATSVQMKPVAVDGQQEIFVDGAPVLVSTKGSTVKIKRTSQSHDSRLRPKFSISIANNTSSPFTFGTENISVQCANKPIKVYSYDELVTEVNEKTRSAELSTAISGAFRANAAATNAGNTRHNGSVYSNSGGSATYYESSYNAGAAQQARNSEDAKTQVEIADVRNNAAQGLAYYSANILKKNTLNPGGTLTGDVLTVPILPPEKETESEVDVTVNAGGELHQFKFLVQKIQK